LDSFSSSGGESNHPHEIIDLLDHANVHSFSSGSFSSLSFHLTIQEICVKSGEALNNTMSPLPSQLLVPSDPSSASAVFKSCTQRDCKEAQKRERLVKSVLMTVASVMFGNNTYHVKAFWSNLLFQRSYQGTICVGLAASMVAGNFLHGSSLLILAVSILPISVVWLEVHCQHAMEETTIAFALSLAAVFMRVSESIASMENPAEKHRDNESIRLFLSDLFFVITDYTNFKKIGSLLPYIFKFSRAVHWPSTVRNQ
jgi:hypothetical protein